MSAKHNQIANHLIADILEGSYRVGEQLPSERDLAARFKTNRGAVREAMKTLQQIGLADINPAALESKSATRPVSMLLGTSLTAAICQTVRWWIKF